VLISKKNEPFNTFKKGTTIYSSFQKQYKKYICFKCRYVKKNKYLIL